MTQPNNPLHGIKLADMLTELHEFYGWEYLGLELNLNCAEWNYDEGDCESTSGRIIYGHKLANSKLNSFSSPIP